jgi:hypothetical protein
MRRFLNRNVLLTLLFLLIALAVYFLNIQSQGEVVSVSIGRFGEKNIVVVPAYHDGAVAWMEALFVTEVPTHTPPPSMTPTPDLVHTPTSTPKPTKTPKGTIASSPTPTDTLRPALTPTTHAYFIGYEQPISTYNTYGSSIRRHFNRQRSPISGQCGRHAWLHIVDVTDPNNPIDTRYTSKQANSVKAIGKTHTLRQVTMAWSSWICLIHKNLSPSTSALRSDRDRPRCCLPWSSFPIKPRG